MSTPFLSEIKIVSFNFAPKGWALCNGQLLPINQNQALFSLLGTTYGGDGRTTFGLPNLQGRIPGHMGNGFTLGEVGGETAHTLNVSEIPTHIHVANANSTLATGTTPANSFWATQDHAAYNATTDGSKLAAGAVGNTGGNQPHENMSPYLVLNFIIALQGIFPSQN